MIGKPAADAHVEPPSPLVYLYSPPEASPAHIVTGSDRNTEIGATVDAMTLGGLPSVRDSVGTGTYAAMPAGDEHVEYRPPLAASSAIAAYDPVVAELTRFSGAAPLVSPSTA